jgi:O-antigen/teichoic acid export membrane protein
MSIRNSIKSGLYWTILDTIFVKGLIFLSTICLSRLLTPFDYGLNGMVSIIVALAGIFIDCGLAISLIRTESADEDDFSTIFYANILISLFVVTLLLLSAGFFARFFNQPILTNIIRVYSISFIFTGLSATYFSVLRKTLAFKKLFYINLPGIICGLTIAFILALAKYGVWSLVILHLTTQVVNFICLYLFSGWKPKIFFSFKLFKLHFNYGYKLLLSGILNISFNNLYNIIIGKFYSVDALGQYERAVTLNDYPGLLVSSILDKATFPILSKIQSDKKRIGLLYRKLIQISFLISAPLMIGAAATAKPLIFLTIGPQWDLTIPLFQILCFASAIYPIHALNIILLKVYGKSDSFLKLEIIKKTILLALIMIAINYNIYLLVTSILFASIIALFINTAYSEDLIEYGTFSQMKDLFPTLIFVLLMALLMNFLTTISSNPILQLAVPWATSIPIYIAYVYYFQSEIANFVINSFKMKNSQM